MIRFFALVVVAFWAPAFAQSATLTEGSAFVLWELYQDDIPDPVCGFEHNESFGQGESFLFDYTLSTYPCNSSWFVHADSDSIVYRGSWHVDNPEDEIWGFSHASIDVEVTLSFSEVVVLFFHSSGDPNREEHSGSFYRQGNGWEMTCGPAGWENSIVVPDGLCTIRLTVFLYENFTHQDYNSTLKFWWEPYHNVPVSKKTWSSIKALYRN